MNDQMLCYYCKSKNLETASWMVMKFCVYLNGSKGGLYLQFDLVGDGDNVCQATRAMMEWEASTK